MLGTCHFCFKKKIRLALTHVQPPYQVNQYFGLRRNNQPITYNFAFQL